MNLYFILQYLINKKANKIKYLYKNARGLNIHQQRRFYEISKYCSENVDLYKKKWAGLDEDLLTLKNINDLPIIDKKDLVKEIKENRLYNSIPKGSKVDYTTGSTGEPFKVVKDNYTSKLHKSDFIFGYQLGGYNLGDKIVRLWRGNLNKTFKDKIKEFVTNKYTICIYDPNNASKSQLNSTRLKEIMIELNSLNPKYIDTFPSALIQIIDYSKDCSYTLKMTKLKGIFTGAEALSDNDREKIESFFSCKVYNRYGGTEFGGIAHECVYGNMHISEYKTYVELINNEIVITDLYNKTLPLIRYNTKDTAEKIVSIKCKCGMESKVIQQISGRVNDMIDGVNGLISSHYWHNIVKKYNDHIDNFQIIQNKDEYSVRIKTIKNCVLDTNIKDKIQAVIPNEIEWLIGNDVQLIKRNGKFSQAIKIDG